MSQQTEDIFLHAESALFGSSQDQFLQDENKLSVAELIPQILMQRKSFLHISEDQLKAEIENSDSALKNDLDGPNSVSPESNTVATNGMDLEVAEVTEADDAESASTAFHRQKSELLSFIGSALNETSLSLDFVSLLMSAEKPGITKSTISPHLAKATPLGSLSADRVQKNVDNQAETAETRKTAENIGLGWKHQSLANVRGLFRDAASSLRAQTTVESKYWRHISSVIAHEEVVYKLRDPKTGGRAIGVQYGYGDSGSTYHDRGLAVLRKNDVSGDITFCPLTGSPNSSNSISAAPRQKYTRVRILTKSEDEDYMVTGQSGRPTPVQDSDSLVGVMADIERARFFLFEDDLFHHLLREAKNLASYSVTIVADKIMVDLGDKIVEVESVVYDEDEDGSTFAQNTSGEMARHNQPAQDILTFLKLMLCSYYQYRLRLKQKMPTSHTKWKQQHSHPLLLRPWLGHTRHMRNVRHMHSLLAKLGHSLDTQGVTHEISENLYANLTSGVIDSPFAKAVHKPCSTFTMVLARVKSSSHLKVDVEVTTTDIFVDLVVRLTVAKYNCHTDLTENQGGTNVLSLEFTDLADVAESLDWTVLNFLDESA